MRHSIPGKLWCQKDFKPEHIFKIMEIAKAKSNRRLLWPYHELVNKRNMSKWTYNIYTGQMSAVCELQYGSKLKNKVGFDHLLICQITRAKTKKSVFFSLYVTLLFVIVCIWFILLYIHDTMSARIYLHMLIMCIYIIYTADQVKWQN